MLSSLTIFLFLGHVYFVATFNQGDPFSLIGPTDTECEYMALTVGSRLCDAFNNREENVGIDDRLNHEYFHSSNHGSSAFLRVIHAEQIHSNSKTLDHKAQGVDNRAHHKHNSSQHILKSLSNKWLYMVGDRTLFSLLRSLVTTLHVHDTHWTYDKWLSDKCGRNGGKLPDITHLDLLREEYKSDLESSIQCTSAGFGHTGKISFDWQELLLELQGPSFLINNTAFLSSQRRPDIVIVQVGFAACFLPYNGTKPTVHESYITESEKKIHAFMTGLKEFQKSGENSNPMQIIISTASRSFLPDYRSSLCTWKLNRIIAYEAHIQGFTVFEREEIEHRITYKSELSENPIIPTTMILGYPVPHIVTTSLLSLISCIDNNVTFSLA